MNITRKERYSLDEVFAFLSENRKGFLATLDAQGYPHVRVVGLQCISGGCLYYATAKTKPMYEQMQACPYVELAVSNPDFSMNLRLTGTATLCDDMALKREIIDASESLTRLYQSAENPIFTLFYIKPKTARFWSFKEDRTIEL
jgi:uncharacterized pyridoxamine 5'-phosphate oxidase family protein